MNKSWIVTTDEKSIKLVGHSQYLTLVYHDLFDYPLLKSELDFWKVGNQDFPNHQVFYDSSFYFLPQRREIVYKRIAAHKESQKKYEIAKKVARILSLVPTIQMISISGLLSMGNAKRNSDVELFIVTSPKTVWATRLVGGFLLSLINYRSGKDNKFCINRWVDVQNLSLADSCEIFTAHEIVQTKVLLDKGGVYRKFIGSNSWVKQFFPNAYKKCFQYSRKYTNFKPSFKNTVIEWLTNKISCLFEKPAKILQRMTLSRSRSEGCTNGKIMLEQKYWQEKVPKLYLFRLEHVLQRSCSSEVQQYID